MATYYVDGNTGNDASGDGSGNRPWKTIGKAVGRVAAGDEVRIRTATYRETLAIRVRNTTWKADTGHTPVIDGRYHDGLFRPDGTLPHPQPGGGYLPANAGGNIILLGEEGITVDGLTVQNAAGTAIGVSRSNCVVRNCRIDFMYETAVLVNPGANYIDNVVVENNICTRISVKYYDPQRQGGGQAGVSGVIKMGRTRDGIIRNNICAYGHGEGINIGKGSYRTIVEGNIVHTCNHVHIYVNRSIDTIIRNNLVYHVYTRDYLGENQRPPAGIIIGDEYARGRDWPYSAGGQIYNNIIVGLGTLFAVRNNAQNYNTQLNSTYIGYNTFVGRQMTDTGIQILGNMAGRNHTDSLFENNVIYNAPRISHSNGNISGVAFRNNLWGEQPDAAMRGPGDRIGNPNLVNPTANLGDAFPNPNGNIDPRNYQLTSRSALAIGLASDGSRVNDLQPPPIRKDFYGANRDQKSDIGAHEYAGVITGLTANFSIGPGQAAGALPHTVDFTDKSTSEKQIVSRQWDFGDGGTSTETNPSYTYTKAGNYDVSLTVTDSQGNTDTLERVALVAVSQVPNTVVPDTFRRFVLSRTADQQVLAYGTQFPDMRCILIWNDVPFHILNFADIQDVERSMVQADTMELLWIDPSDQDELPLGEENELESVEEPQP